MNKTYMKEVANLLGVELEEEFKLTDKSFEDYVYKFTDTYLFTKPHDSDYWFASSLLADIVNGTYEIEKHILTQKEKEYLSAVIKPFRHSVTGVIKVHVNKDEEYIEIYVIKSEDEQITEYVNLPTFKEGTMYKGMKANRCYAVEELGLLDENS